MLHEILTKKEKELLSRKAKRQKLFLFLSVAFFAFSLFFVYAFFLLKDREFLYIALLDFMAACALASLYCEIKTLLGIINKCSGKQPPVPKSGKREKT